MKVRSGFVSNSSSSSFVMLFPEDFDVEKIDWSKFDFVEFAADYCYEDGDYDDDAEEIDDRKPVDETLKTDIVKGLKKLLGGETLWDEEDATAMAAIELLFPDYIIAEISTDSDGGQMALADRVKAKKILGVA
jgi:hypothetical protein